jgi:hypothetical protein
LWTFIAGILRVLLHFFFGFGISCCSWLSFTPTLFLGVTMREETIPIQTVSLSWYDERQGRGQVSNLTEVVAICHFYQLSFDAMVLPFDLENEHFHLQAQLSAPSLDADLAMPQPITVVVSRKPQGAIQAAAWQYATETQQARIELVDAQLGVRFLDEDMFVSFDHLALDEYGGFKILPFEEQ